MLSTIRFFGRQLVFLLVPLAVTLALALVSGCGCPNCAVPVFHPTPVPTASSALPPGVVACSSSGTGAVAVLCVGSKTYAFVGKGLALQNTVEQIDISSGAAADASTAMAEMARAPAPAAGAIQALAHPSQPVVQNRPAFHTAAVFHTYTFDFPVTECQSDESTLTVFCAAYHYPPAFTVAKIAVIDEKSLTNAEFDTPASTSALLGFSGGSCVICAIAFDPMDKGFIVEDVNPSGSGCAGGQCGQYQLVPEASPHTITHSIATGDPNENPGYDYVKDWIFNPGYNTGDIEVADFTKGKLFVTKPIANVSVPDSACVDVTTHIGNTGNEFTPPDIVTLADLGTATESGSTLTVATGQTTLVHSSDQGLDIDACATDSVIHVTFYAGEFGTSLLGFALLPTTSGGTHVSDWAFASFPNTPDGSAWASARDPHPITGFNAPANCLDCAISINEPFTWMAVVDLAKFVKAPRSKTDSHVIDPTYNLQKNGVLKYYAI